MAKYDPLFKHLLKPGLHTPHYAGVARADRTDRGARAVPDRGNRSPWRVSCSTSACWEMRRQRDRSRGLVLLPNLASSDPVREPHRVVGNPEGEYSTVGCRCLSDRSSCPAVY